MKASLLISAFTTSYVFFGLPLSQIPSVWIAWYFFSTCVVYLNQPHTLPNSSYTQFFSSLICTSSLMQTNELFSRAYLPHFFLSSLLLYIFYIQYPYSITMQNCTFYNHHAVWLLLGLRIPLLSAETIMP